MATEVASVFVRVGADLSGFKSGMMNMNSTLTSTGSAFRNFTAGIVQGIGQAFGIATIRTIRTFGDTLAGVIGSAASMEQSVADIAAVMGLAGEETGKLEKLISDLAVDPRLRVSATEAAQAIEMLGRNGVDLTDVLDGAARSTVLLANSTGGDFATSADIATDVMQQFKIGADGMADAVDQIVGVTSNSKLSLDKYRLAISQAGGVAGAVGVEFDDFNAALVATAASFASGSDQGTAFKVFLQRLVPDTGPAIEAMTELGIVTADGGNRFFDASGKMKSMSEIAGIMQEAFAGLSEEQKINAATTIFGTDAMRMAFAIADAGAGTIDELKRTIGDTSAEEKAAIRTDTLAAKWATFKDIIENYTRQIGAPFLESLTKLTEKLQVLANIYGPKVVEWAERIAEKFQRVMEAGLALLGVGIDKGFAAIFEVLPDGTRELDKLWEAFGMTKDEAKAASQQFLDTTARILEVTAATVEAIGKIGSIVVSIGNWIDKMVGLENVLKVGATILAGSFVASIISTISTIVSAIASIASFVGSLSGLAAVATTVGAGVSAAIAAIGGPITLIVAAIAALAIAWHQNWWDIRGKTEEAWQAIKHFVGSGIQFIKDAFSSGWWDVGRNMVNGIVDGIRSGWNWLTDTARDLANSARNTAESTLGIQSPSKVFKQIGQQVTAGFAEGIETTSMAPVVSVNRMMMQTATAAPAIDAPLGIGSGVASARRVDVYLHGESNLPADRTKLRELARALQQEFVFSGGRVAVA